MIPRPKKLNSFLDRLVKDATFGDGIKLRLFQRRWEDFVGSGMREHSWPIKYEKGRLVVVVSNAVWRQELIQNSRALIALINRSDLHLRDIFYILGKPAPIAQIEEEEELQPLTPQEEKRLQEFHDKTLEKIPNEGLTNRLTRIREKQMRGFHNDRSTF